MELQGEKEKSRIIEIFNGYIRRVDWLELFYLVLFIAFVMKKYLGSTALEWQLPEWFDTVVRGGIHAYILVRIYDQAVIKETMKWNEVTLMAAMIFVGEMITLYTGDIIISDTLLFIIGAKGVNFKKICFVYLCVAVSIQLIALYMINAGYIANYIYEDTDRVRNSWGVAYPTDFAAHIMGICAVYVCWRERKLTFVEIALILISGVFVYSTTYARNDTIGILAIGILCLVVKVLGLFKIQISKCKWMNILAFSIIALFIVSVWMAAAYDENSSLMVSLDRIFSQRLTMGHVGLQRYGIHLFGTQVAENGLGFGSVIAPGFYFFLDSAYVRILIKYGYIFAVLISIMFISIFFRVRKLNKDYILVVLLVMLITAFVEHHFFDLSFNLIWLLLFSQLTHKDSSEMKKARIQ